MNLLIVLVFVLSFLSLSCGTSSSTREPETTPDRSALEYGINLSVSPATPTPALPQAEEEYREALERIWIDTDQFEVNGISITRNCKSEPQNDYMGACELSIKSKGITLRSFSVEHGRKHWLKYGVFNFLGTANKQLIVFSYSGGAHCCYDYVIFELVPTLRVIYDSNCNGQVKQDTELRVLLCL
ncbi:MAG: hypothetical protein WKF92_16385, partial [Pyrinomonadaceae bacterium]